MFVFNFYSFTGAHLNIGRVGVNDHYIKFYFNGSPFAFCVQHFDVGFGFS